MPKIVNHAHQRRLVAKATLKLMSLYGVGHISVRSIAREANMSVGAMRHYMATQDELYLFVYKLFQEQIAKRMTTQKPTGSPLEQLQEILEQLLPLDDERYLEASFWLAFVARAHNSPTLQEKLLETHEDLRSYVRAVIEVLNQLQPAKMLRGTDVDLLLAFLDGLTINHLQNRRQLPPARIQLILRNYLNSLIEA